MDSRRVSSLKPLLHLANYRMTTIANGLESGLHKLHCEVANKTSNPQGGNEFRIIAIMSI